MSYTLASIMAKPDVEVTPPPFVPVRDRTIKGVVAMLLRQFIVMPVSFAASIWLARLLQPSDFGLYAVASFWISIIVGFRDVGFAAALIQQPDEPRQHEWNTIFTFQLALVSVTVALLYLLAEPLTRLYQMDPRMTWVIRGLSLILFIGLLGSMPHVMLERRLAYDVIARIDVIATLAFHSCAVTLALLGFSVWSFIVAALLNELIRGGLLFRHASWRVGFCWNNAFLKSALRFGGLYQLGGFTSLLRDNIPSLLAGPLFGLTAVGYLQWAERTAYLTSQVFTQIVTRVSFPTVSRIQQQPERIGPAVEKMLRYLMLATVPTLAIGAALIPWIIQFVFTNKWAPATFAFYMLTVRMLGGNITTPFIGVLNATGQVTTSLRILVAWTAVDWVLALVLTRLWGFNGVAIAYAVGVGLPVIWLLWAFGRRSSLNLGYAIGRPLIAGIMAGVMTWGLGRLWITNLTSLAGVVALGLIQYLLVMTVLERGRFLQEIKQEARLVKSIMTAQKGESR